MYFALGQPATAVIDSGSKYNMVYRETWTGLKSNNIYTMSRHKETDKMFVAYGGKTLKLMGVFKANVQIAGESSIADFYVVDESGNFCWAVIRLWFWEEAIDRKIGDMLQQGII